MPLVAHIKGNGLEVHRELGKRRIKAELLQEYKDSSYGTVTIVKFDILDFVEVTLWSWRSLDQQDEGLLVPGMLIDWRLEKEPHDA